MKNVVVKLSVEENKFSTVSRERDEHQDDRLSSVLRNPVHYSISDWMLNTRLYKYKIVFY